MLWYPTTAGQFLSTRFVPRRQPLVSRCVMGPMLTSRRVRGPASDWHSEVAANERRVNDGVLHQFVLTTRLECVMHAAHRIDWKKEIRLSALHLAHAPCSREDCE